MGRYSIWRGNGILGVLEVLVFLVFFVLCFVLLSSFDFVGIGVILFIVLYDYEVWIEDDFIFIKGEKFYILNNM